MDRKITQYQFRKGDPEIPGACATEEGTNFTMSVPDGSTAQLILADSVKNEIIQKIPFPQEVRTGELGSVFISDFDYKKHGYYYIIDNKKVLDPFARAFSGGVCRVADPYQEKPEALLSDVPLNEMMIYKLHVRGFTKSNASSVKNRGTFAGVEQKLDYIRDLGFTTIEFMPMYEWDDTLRMFHMEGPDGKYKVPKNYWGYSEKNFYFAPKELFSSSPDSIGEVVHLISAMHKRGMEAVMEIYVPDPCDPLIIYSAAHYWKRFYRIDGFHFLGRSVPEKLFVNDSYFAHTKLFFEHVGDAAIRDTRGQVRRNLLEYNDGFMIDCRSFLKGDEGKTASFAMHLHENYLTRGCVNYMANVNGFTLMDAVSYDWKHNEKNGEDNQDGPSVNMSWNCGVEGPTRKTAIRKLRNKQIKNALSYLFFSQGVPLLMAGDEFGNSQEGNNNAYSSDDTTGWVDWKMAGRNTALTNFVRSLTAYRKKHLVLHMSRPLRETDYMSYGYPDISYHDTKAWFCPFENASRSLGIMYCGLYADKAGKKDDFLYVACNAYWEEHVFALPSLPKGLSWFADMRTNAENMSEFDRDISPIKNQRAFTSAPRSVTVLIGRMSGKA